MPFLVVVDIHAGDKANIIGLENQPEIIRVCVFDFPGVDDLPGQADRFVALRLEGVIVFAHAKAVGGHHGFR